nr:hypothetical protein [Tanacetum cinerariifolium]
MVAYLNKSDASEGFNQVTDFLNGSYIKYALTINPHIYVSCIKQFWNTVVVKQTNDVTRLQALVDKKKVMITEATIRDALRLDDAKGVDCLPNEEIFIKLARMGYEKPSTKLTFYKAFFSSQWKFLIHIILQSISAKHTSWNEFSSAMASAIICLSTGRKFNFSKYIFESLVRNVDNSSKFYMYPRVGKGCSGVETPLFEGMLVAGEPEVQDDVQDQSIPSPTPPTPPPQPPQDIPSTSQEALDACVILTKRVEHLEHDKVAQDLEIAKLKTRVKKLERANKDASNQRRMIAELDRYEGITMMDDDGEEKKAEDAQVAGDEQVKGRQAEIYQIDMDHASKVLMMQEAEPEVQEVVEVVTTAKLITKVVVAVSESVSAVSATIAAVPAATITAAPVRVAAASIRKRKGVVIKDPKEESESTAKTPTETKSKDKGKGIMVEEQKPMKKKQQVEMNEEHVRKLHEELNKDIDWDFVIDHVKQKAKEDPLDYFKGMSYDDIRPIFEAKFNSNIKFLLKSKEKIEEEENRALENINETPAHKAAKRRKLNKEVEDLKQHLEIVPDEDNDVYTETTPVVRKVPVNFDREDLESLWSIVKERFSTSKLNNYSDDYLLTTLRVMFGRLDGQDQLILLVEKRYPLSRFTLDQMLNVVRLQVEEQSEMSLELLSKELASPKKMALGKDISNPFMAGSLPKTIWSLVNAVEGFTISNSIEEPISMYCDNTGAIAIAKDDGVTKGARHFRAKVHYLRETIKLGDLKIEKIHTDDNLADPFTKALGFPKHSELTRNIGLLPASSFM